MTNEPCIDLSNHRINKAKDLLEQADLLLKNGSFDGCINRSYYAIFSSVRSLLALINLDSSKHTGVISYFDRYFIKTGILDKLFSQILHSAFEVRQMSDYADYFIPTVEQAQEQFKNAESLINEIELKRGLLIQKQIPLPDVE